MSFSFGSPAGGGFGTQGTPGGGGFGAPSSSAPSFGSFGTPAASGANTGGFGGAAATPSFGAPATAATTSFGGFGSQGAAKPASFGGFGSPAPASGTSTLGGFGTPAASAGGFGTTSQTPAAGGFGSTTQPASSFGGFGTPAAAPAASGFGGFGSAAKPATTSSFGGFGTPAAAPSSSFGGFGTPAPAATTSFGSFGTAASNTQGSAFGASTNTGFGNPSTNNMSAYGAPVVPVSMSEAVCEFPVETQYKDMPAPYKAEIDRTWKEMKQPMKMKLEEISRSRGVIFDEVHSELRRIHLAVLNVENEQRRLQGEIRPFLQELKRTSETGRLQAAIGLQQIRNQSMGTVLQIGNGNDALRNLLDEELPCKWYHLVAEQLSSRLSRCIETVHNYERQLATRLQAIQGNSGSVLGAGRGSYGQLRRVGVQELVNLMQEQAKVFLQIAAAVAQIHKEADAMRQMYLSLKNGNNNKSPRGLGMSGSSSSLSGRSVNPFEDADRKEAAEQRVLEQRIHSEAARYHQQQQLQQQQPASQSQQAAQAGATGGFAAPAAAGGLGGFGGAGGFGASTTPSLGGFGSPAGTSTSTLGGFGGLGSTTPAAAGAAAPAAGGGFGGFGGFGATTPAAGASAGAGAVGGALGGFGAAPSTPAAGGLGGFGGFGSPTPGAAASTLGGKSSFAALDLATPAGGFGAPAAGGFGGFGAAAAPTPGGPNNPNRRTKNKK